MDVSFAFFVRFTPWQFGVGWRRLASVTHRRLRRGRMLENIPHLKFIRVSYVARMETQLPLTRESRRPGADHQNDENSAYAARLQKLPLTRPTSTFVAETLSSLHWLQQLGRKPEIGNNNNTPFSVIVVALLTCKPWRDPKSTKLIIKFLRVVSAVELSRTL
jgi:hypothetical protein